MGEASPEDEPSSEAELMRSIQRGLASLQGLCLWRANVGTGWTGDKPRVSMSKGSKTVLITHARPFSSGLPEGFPDLFGVYNGRPVFIEVKMPGGVVRPRQKAFIEAMKQQGCLAGIARNVEDARSILQVK